MQQEEDSVDMRYDANGNLIYDADRGISVIKYNIHNLPDTIQFVNGNQIVNLYDAIGQKYKSIVYTNLSTTMTPYYSIAHYPLDADTIWYNITEYAGNIENHYSRTDTTQRIFNSKRFKFTGKERDTETGYDYFGARYYLPDLPIWLSPDPLADKYPGVSPYAYCHWNPVKYIDPDGKDWYSTYDENGDKVFLYNSDVHSQEDLDKAKIKGTYEGATKEYNGVYYSLFGHQMPSNSYEGQIYKILDDALIRKAAYEKEEAYLATHPSAFSSEVNLSPQITFQVNGVNIGTPYRVEYEGGQGVFYPVEKNRGRMVNWPGDSNMPMIISGYLSGDNKPAYHLRYMNDTRMDLIHIKFDKKNAQEFLQKYQRQFYPH